MTADELLARYPDCPTAVAYCELILDQCNDDDPETTFEMMRSVDPPMTPAEWLRLVKDALAGETECKAPQALAEMDHPSFAVYLRAKMGMM